MHTSSATETGDPTPGCQPNFGRGVWFTVTSPNLSGVVVLRTCASGFDTVVQAYSGSCGALTPLACNNETGVVCSPPARASVFFPVVAGQTYPVLVGGLGGAGGALELQAWLAEFFPGTSSDGTEIAISNGAENASATISFTFHDSCGSVKSWGVPVQNGTNIVVDIQSIHYVGGGCLAVLEERSHTYDLGSLAPGNYTFQWKNFGTSIMSVPFTVPAPTHTYTPYALTNFAGLPGVSGTNNATGSAARFNFPSGTAVDSAGNVYVADGSFTVRKITPAGQVTTLAGSAGQPGSTNGIGSAARFNSPSGVVVDSATNLYVADTDNQMIRKITPVGTNWVVTTLGGSAGQQGNVDGTGSAARFKFPAGVAVDSAGNVFVADSNNGTIRKITPARTVTTLAGSAGIFGSSDGTGAAARFSISYALTVDSVGNVYLADSGNHAIRKITPDGAVTTLAGSAGQVGSADGSGSAARFNRPQGVAVDSAGNVYVADTLNNRITKGTPPIPFQFSFGSLTLAGGRFQMWLTGPSGRNVIVERSANLQTWTPIQTNTVPPGGLNLSVPVGTDRNLCFRARLAP